jgi:hypothetical protein
MTTEYDGMEFDELLEEFDDLVRAIHDAARAGLGPERYDRYARGCLADIDLARANDHRWLGRAANTLEDLALELRGEGRCEACERVAVLDDGLCADCRVEEEPEASHG